MGKLPSRACGVSGVRVVGECMVWGLGLQVSGFLVTAQHRMHTKCDGDHTFKFHVALHGISALGTVFFIEGPRV